MIQLAVLLTVHNRKMQTLAALEALYGQAELAGEAAVSVYVVDDASTDGTSAAVAERFPEVSLLQGTGNLYWNGGMRHAFGEALKIGHDYYLWLNDDTTLFPTALVRLLDSSFQLGSKAIVAASVQDSLTSQLTYGGVRRLDRWRPLKFTKVMPREEPVPVETMNGNCVLVPQAVAQVVGNLDPLFTHGMGDFDYGLRARKLGFEIYLAPGYYGYCQINPPEDKELSLNARWEKLLSPLGLPPFEWAGFARRYAGPFWFLYFLSPYIQKFIKFKDS